MNDTSAEAEAFVKARFAAMTPSQRALMALQMFETAQRVVLSSLPPGLDEDRRRRELCRRFYGEAVARAAFGPARNDEVIEVSVEKRVGVREGSPHRHKAQRRQGS